METKQKSLFKKSIVHTLVFSVSTTFIDDGFDLASHSSSKTLHVLLSQKLLLFVHCNFQVTMVLNKTMPGLQTTVLHIPDMLNWILIQSHVVVTAFNSRYVVTALEWGGLALSSIYTGFVPRWWLSVWGTTINDRKNVSDVLIPIKLDSYRDKMHLTVMGDQPKASKSYYVAPYPYRDKSLTSLVVFVFSYQSADDNG